MDKKNKNDLNSPSDEKPIKKSVYLKSKPRYEILDGLRGVASFLVILFHIFETLSGLSPVEQIINHGYLAVDFFYALSGFVIGYAYDDRWDRMSLCDFFKRRLIRLHPMVIAGTITGFCLFYFQQQSEAFRLIDDVNPYKFFIHLILALLMIPCWPSIDIRGWSETNGFNGPSWTLTYEYFANILYALTIRFLNNIGLAIIVLLGSILNVILTFNFDFLKLFGESHEAQKYTVIGGWSLTSDQIFIGVTRLIYPFFMGYLVYRLKLKIKIKFGFFICSLILSFIFCCPRIGGISKINSIYESISILFVFPLIVMIGAGSEIENKKLKSINKFLGEISYPIYITHYPLIYLQTAWFFNNREKLKLFQKIISAVGIIIFAVAFSYGCLKIYDEPVRKWLTEKLLIKNKNLKEKEEEKKDKENKDEKKDIKEGDRIPLVERITPDEKINEGLGIKEES